MSLLAHKATPWDAATRRKVDDDVRFETQEAKRIQAQVGCSWGEALRLASKGKLNPAAWPD